MHNFGLARRLSTLLNSNKVSCVHTFGLARPLITLLTSSSASSMHNFGLARPHNTLLNPQVAQLRLPHQLKVLNGCRPAERGGPMEVIIQVDEFLQVAIGQGLVGDRTGGLLLPRGATIRLIRSRAADHLQLLKPSGFAGDDAPQPVRGVVRIRVADALVLPVSRFLPLRSPSIRSISTRSGSHLRVMVLRP